MKPISFNEYNETAKKYGKQSAQKLGERLLERAKALEANGAKPPINLMEIRTSRYEIQINYLGKKGLGLISVLDTCDPYDGKPNGQPVQDFGDAEATLMSVVSQLEWIDSIHHEDPE